MAIVSRRVLQRLIVENAAFMSVAQQQQHADAINRGGAKSLSFEWEILVLNALSKQCRVSHEPTLGSRQPDVLACLEGESPETFVADVATAFEESDNDRNPVERLSDLVSDHAWRRHGMSGNGFQLDVRGDREGVRGRQRMQLKLPPKSSLERFFQVHVAPFVDAVASEPRQQRQETILADGAHVTISYHPGRNTAGMSYPSYTIPYSLTNNPIFRAVDGKIDQLKETTFDSPKCVILCGADATLPRRRVGLGFGLKEISAELFRQNTSLSAVVTLYVAPNLRSSALQYHCDVYTNPRAKDPLGHRSVEVLQGLPKFLPRPLRDGHNAVLRLESPRRRRGYYDAGFTYSRSMSMTKIKISSRELMSYLAAGIDYKAFLKGLGPGNDASASLRGISSRAAC